MWVELRAEVATVGCDELLAATLPAHCTAPSAGERTVRTGFLRQQAGGRTVVRAFLAGEHGEVDAHVDALAAAWRAAGLAVETSPIESPFATVDLPFSGPGVADLVADFLADVSAALIDIVTAVARGDARRTGVALDVMTAHLAAVEYSRPGPGGPLAAVARELPVPLSFPALRAHADGFITLNPDPDGVRARLAAQYAPMADAVRDRVAAVLAQCRSGGPVVAPLAVPWFEQVARYRAELQRRLSAGDVVVRWAGLDELFATRSVWDTPMQQFVHDSPRFRDFMRGDPGYQSLRVMMSMLYLVLYGALGVAVPERVFLCHAVSSACERLAGVDAVAVLGAIDHAYHQPYGADRA